MTTAQVQKAAPIAPKAAVPSAKPIVKTTGDNEDEGSGRTPHPFIDSKDSSVYPLKQVPQDYDPKQHSPLKKKDFADEATFFDYRAAMAEAQVAKFKRMAAEVRATGSSADKAQTKRFLSMAKKMEELKKALGGKVDLAQLLAAAGIKS